MILKLVEKTLNVLTVRKVKELNYNDVILYTCRTAPPGKPHVLHNYIGEIFEITSIKGLFNRNSSYFGSYTTNMQGIIITMSSVADFTEIYL